MATRLLGLVFRRSIGTGRHPDSVARRRGQAVALLMLAIAAVANGDPVADKSVHLAADKPARIQPLPALREQAVERQDWLRLRLERVLPRLMAEYGVPVRGEAVLLPSTWHSIELQATAPIPEWGGKPASCRQEEEAYLDAGGVRHWVFRRQSRFHLVR